MTDIEPTTGVYSGYDLPWEWIDYTVYIDLAYEEAVDELKASGMSDEDIVAELEYFDSGDEQLYGDWIKVNAAGEPDDNGKYAPNPDGEFALIYDSDYNVGQLVYSKWVRYGQPASPCYPGQVDARLDDPDQPEGGIATSAVPVEQIYCTGPRTRSVPYFAFPQEAYE